MEIEISSSRGFRRLFHAGLAVFFTAAMTFCLSALAPR
jgi:hypothetical protein